MKTKLLKFLSCCLLVKVLFLRCTSPTPQTEPTTNDMVLNREDVVEDMFCTSEGTPHGVPYDWGGRSSFGRYTTTPHGFTNWTEVLSWGQVYASNHDNQCTPRPGYPVRSRNCVNHELCRPNTTFPNIRVHLKDLELYIYRNNNTWERLDHTDFFHKTNPNHHGHFYVEDFLNDTNKPGDIQFEPEGGISIQAGSGWNFHFWGNTIKPDPNNLGIKGIFVVCKARLIGVEGDQDPKYLLSIGTDHWRSDGLKDWGDTNPTISVAIGRFRYVTKEWQYHTMHSFTTRSAAEAAIINNPTFSEALLNGGIICN